MKIQQVETQFHHCLNLIFHSYLRRFKCSSHIENFYCINATKCFITFVGSWWKTMTASWRLTANERAGEWILNHHFNDCSTKQTLLSSLCTYRFTCLHCSAQVYFHETNQRDMKMWKDKTNSKQNLQAIENVKESRVVASVATL